MSTPAAPPPDGPRCRVCMKPQHLCLLTCSQPPAIAEGYQGIGLTADDLVERAVRNAGHGGTVERVRWSWVGSVFGLGSTSSARLCRRFGLDPDDMLGEDPDDPEDDWNDR